MGPSLPAKLSPQEILRIRNSQQKKIEERITNISFTDVEDICIEYVRKIEPLVKKVLLDIKKGGSSPKWAKQMLEIGVKRTLILGIFGILSTMQEPKDDLDRYECAANKAVGYIASRAQKIYGFQMGTVKERKKNKLFAWNLIHALVMSKFITIECMGSGKEKLNILALTSDGKDLLYRGHKVLRDPIMSPMLVHPIDHHMGVHGMGGRVTSSLRRTIKQKWKIGKSDALCEALNHLQSTKWMINEHVWNVVTHANVFGDDIKKWENFVKGHEAHTQIITTLDLATSLIDRIVDFPGDDSHFFHAWEAGPRGRLYSRCPYISPQGGDLNRGLIRFAESKPITEKGIKWLKVYIAGLFKGVDLCGGNKIPDGFTWNKMKHINPSIPEMIEWFDENEMILLAIGERPMEFINIWWNDRDKNDLRKRVPFGKKKSYFQRVAATHDYWQAQKTGKSSIAVILDGTCNGQQHVAAIMRDRKHAKLVDLLSGYNEVDFYERVAVEVLALITLPTNEIPIKKLTSGAHDFLKLNSKYFITRSFAKKPVMVLGYGAGERAVEDEIFDKAGRKSIKNRKKLNYNKIRKIISEIKTQEGKGKIDEEWLKDARLEVAEIQAINDSFPAIWHKDAKTEKYRALPGPESILNGSELSAENNEALVAKNIAILYFEAFNRVASSALVVRESLEECVKGSESPIEWNTLAGFTVKHRYKKKDKVFEKYKDKNGDIKKRLENRQLTATNKWGTKSRKIRIAQYFDDQFDEGKMKRSVSPNFIHSLDASHMILTINEMAKQGVQCFQMIHDAFGTHAENCDLMHETVRKTFVQLHKDDPFHRLLEKYGVEIPKKGDLDLDEILKSEYIIH
jgi:DNA-directed RNA polymerase